MKCLKKFLKKRPNEEAGRTSLPAMPSAVSEYYTKIDPLYYWQGDVFHMSSFKEDARLPSEKYEYWMLLNRTCQLFQNPATNRKIKLSHMNFVAVDSLKDYLDYGPKKQTLKNQIKYTINKEEDVIFLPESLPHNLNTPLVGLFNLIVTVSTDNSPESSQKKIQLSSPFSEHVFQKFSRFFYSVGFDDENLKTDAYYDKWACEMEKIQPQ